MRKDCKKQILDNNNKMFSLIIRDDIYRLLSIKIPM